MDIATIGTVSGLIIGAVGGLGWSIKIINGMKETNRKDHKEIFDKLDKLSANVNKIDGKISRQLLNHIGTYHKK